MTSDLPDEVSDEASDALLSVCSKYPVGYDDCARMMALELIRRRHAERTYAERNPLGGPAKVFDAMASRIRAGEEYYAVLADYGFSVTPK